MKRRRERWGGGATMEVVEASYTGVFAMTKMMLMLGFLSVIALPSCMHPVDNVLHARAESKARLLEAQGHVSQGACDDVGQYAAKSAGRGFTLEIASASAQGLR